MQAVDIKIIIIMFARLARKFRLTTTYFRPVRQFSYHISFVSGPRRGSWIQNFYPYQDPKLEPENKRNTFQIEVAANDVPSLSQSALLCYRITRPPSRYTTNKVFVLLTFKYIIRVRYQVYKLYICMCNDFSSPFFLFVKQFKDILKGTYSMNIL